MGAINRFVDSTKFNTREEFISLGVTCVFISHQKDDTVQARKIADFLQEAGIEVYFDEYDEDLKAHHQKGNPRKVTKAICNGINNSTHMLVVVSQRTLESNWVPFEIGYGFEKTELYVLCLKEISKSTLPEYMHTATILRDIASLKKLVKNLKGSEEALKGDILQSIMEELIEDDYIKK